MRGSSITQQTFDQRTQAKRVGEASVKAQEASVREATLDLEFTELRAPLAGRIGDRRVSAGNLVTDRRRVGLDGPLIAPYLTVGLRE